MKRKAAIYLVLALLMTSVTGCGGCGKKDNAENDKTETALQDESEDIDSQVPEEPEAEEPDSSADDAVYNNGGHFVKVGTKVYYIKQAPSSLEQTALWGEYINEYYHGEGNSIMCYDTAAGGEAVRVGEANGNGRLCYYNGFLYGNGVDSDSNPFVYAVDLESGRAFTSDKGTIVDVDENTGRYVIRYSDDTRNYFAVYEGRKQIGLIESDVMANNCEAFIFEDYIIFRVIEGVEVEYMTDEIFAYNFKTDTHIMLGTVPEPEDGDYYNYMKVREAEIKDGYAYVNCGWYAGTGNFLQESVVFKANLDTEYSIEECDEAEALKIFKDPYSEEERDTTYDELFDLSYGEGDRNIMEVCEEVDGETYAIVNSCHYNPSESIGWRDAYTIDAIHFYRIKNLEADEIDSPVEFPDNAAYGRGMEYRVSNPNSWSYTNGSIDTDVFADKLILKEISKSANEIIDIDEWFINNGLSQDFDSGDYEFVLRNEYSEESDSGYFVDLYDKDTGVCSYSLDLSEFYNPWQVTDNDPGLKAGWKAEFRFGYAEDDSAYISMYHMTYADTMQYHAYIMKVDLTTGLLMWKSKPLTCNSNNFVVMDDVIICGYGFTAEPDFIYQIDKENGFILEELLVKSAPDYFVYEPQSQRLYVRTYNTDYVYSVNK